MKKRYTTEKQLIDAIDQCHIQGRALLAEADALEDQGRMALRNPKSVEHGRWQITQAKKLRKRATTKLERRAPALGEKLSEFRTELLPNTGITDRSVLA